MDGWMDPGKDWLQQSKCKKSKAESYGWSDKKVAADQIFIFYTTNFLSANYKLLRLKVILLFIWIENILYIFFRKTEVWY